VSNRCYTTNLNKETNIKFAPNLFLAGAPLRTSLGEFTALPQIAGLRGHISKGVDLRLFLRRMEERGRGWAGMEGKGRRGRGQKGKEGTDLGVTWVCVHDLTWHQNDLKVD